MSQQRGTQAQNQAKTAGQSEARSHRIPGHRYEQPEDAVLGILGSRAASRQMRLAVKQSGGLSEGRSRHSLLQSLSSTSPRVKAKLLFRGVSREWSDTASTGLVIQPKLTVGAAGDQYEQEADRVAAAVVEKIHVPGAAVGGQAVQREPLENEDDLRMKPMPLLQREAMEDDDELQLKPLVQRVGAEGGAVSADLEGEINRAHGRGQPLAPDLQTQMGQAMGADFSGVRVHTDGRADVLNQSVGARAFTTGQDLFFKRGEYQPGSRDGQELIAHELTHVVQQDGGDRPLTSIRRSTVQQNGWKNVWVTNYFQHVHLAQSKEDAIAKSLARDDDGYGLHNTVVKGTLNTVKNAVRNATWENTTLIRETQWKVPIAVPYWFVEMYGGSGGYTLKSVDDKSSGMVTVKAYFNTDAKWGNSVCVTGVATE